MRDLSEFPNRGRFCQKYLVKYKYSPWNLQLIYGTTPPSEIRGNFRIIYLFIFNIQYLCKKYIPPIEFHVKYGYPVKDLLENVNRPRKPSSPIMKFWTMHELTMLTVNNPVIQHCHTQLNLNKEIHQSINKCHRSSDGRMSTLSSTQAITSMILIQ